MPAGPDTSAGKVGKPVTRSTGPVDEASSDPTATRIGDEKKEISL